MLNINKWFYGLCWQSRSDRFITETRENHGTGTAGWLFPEPFENDLVKRGRFPQIPSGNLTLAIENDHL